MEIYERRHPFDALAFSIPILLYMVLCLLVMARPELLRGSVLRIFFYVLSGVFLVWFVFSFGIRVRRYLQLCVKRVPALVIEPDRLCIFTPFAREPLPLDWNAISDFETFHARGGNYCLPVYTSASLCLICTSTLLIPMMMRFPSVPMRIAFSWT